MPAPTGSLLVGDRNQEATLDGDVSGDAEAFSYLAAATGKSAKVSFYVDPANRATGGWLGVYTDSGWDSPGKLLKQVWFRPTAGWDTVKLSGVSIASGHKYWLAVLGTGGPIAFRDQGYGGTSVENSRSGLTSLPASWSDGTAWSSGKASFYVTA